MKKYLLLICIVFFSFRSDKEPAGWIQVEKTKIGGDKFEVYFFDYMSKLQKLQPDFQQYKGRKFTNLLKKIQFQYPGLVARMNVSKEDSVLYFILRPDTSKMDQMYSFNLEIVKLGKNFPLDSLENRENYKEKLKKVVDAKGCRNSLTNEYNLLIQKHPNRDKLIGNGIQITDSIYTRVIPYEEAKKPFFRLIEANQ